ncbi:MAG: hypothetical protein IPL78_21200 [Chloroflexi bacterium]|nr:hypothetical protein [Chloroflexota bacterium]
MSRKYFPIPAGPDATGRVELYKVNYADQSTGWAPEESEGDPVPYQQAKEIAQKRTQQYNQNKPRR